MTAKDMFEEAGYFYDETPNEIVIFKTWYDFYDVLHNEELIRFKKNNYKLSKLIFKKEISLNFKKEIDIKLFKAINKQIEELGWLDD